MLQPCQDFVPNVSTVFTEACTIQECTQEGKCVSIRKMKCWHFETEWKIFEAICNLLKFVLKIEQYRADYWLNI